MKDIFDLVNAIKETQVNEKIYVFFQQDTGEIKKIGGKSVNDRLSSIEVDISTVSSLLHGKESLADFKVEYDLTQKQFIVKKINKNDNNTVVLSKFIEVTNSKHEDTEVLLVQNLKKGCWFVKLSDSVYKQFNEQLINLRASLFFSVTKRKDPNILYRTITIPFENFITYKNSVRVDFISDFEHIKNGASVYTQEYFKNYQHKVINR